jgi:hypothetical protein
VLAQLTQAGGGMRMTELADRALRSHRRLHIWMRTA